MSSRLSRDELAHDLRQTFPALGVRSSETFLEGGVDVFGDGTVMMPDGFSIFNDLCCSDAEEYDGYVHTAFSAWLERRGWYLECIDPQCHCAVPLPTDEERAQWAAEAHAYAIATQGPPNPFDFPF